MLIDNHGREVDYLRMAVTDRCNLRCSYCMPKEGLQWLPRKDVLSYEEIITLLRHFAQLGIRKVRFTGGEPFLRKDFMQLLERVSNEKLFDHIYITTNGTLTLPYISQLKKIGVSGVNLSLDTLNRERFAAITHRDDFDTVISTLHQLLEHDIPTKINAVVMSGKNEEDMLSLAELTSHLPVAVRFIEEMPFNGTDVYSGIKWNHQAILQHLQKHFGPMQLLQSPGTSTSINYRIEDYKGTIGIIAAYTRSFCGTCNRLRLTPQGDLQTCLYGGSAVNLRDALRNNEDINSAILLATGKRAKDGHEAELKNQMTGKNASMATIGG